MFYEIETPSGWSKFDGIKKTNTNLLIKLSFSDNTYLKCTPGHLLKFPNGEFLEACDIVLGDVLANDKCISSIELIYGDFEVYDILNVKLGNEYYTSGCVSHNCAFINRADELWAAAQPTRSTGGKCFIVSTPNGIGGFYHKMWVSAVEKGTMNAIKLPWTVHPERDQTWYDKQAAELGSTKTAQELECEFITSGHTVIDSEILKWYLDTYIKEPIEKRGFAGDLWIWEYPDYSRDYIICADVARGDGSDYSTFHVIDVETITQVAEFKSKIGTREFGRTLIAIATEYNNALLSIENSSIGWDTVQEVLDVGYKNLYYSMKQPNYVDEHLHIFKGYDLMDKTDLVPGFTMSTRTRPLTISRMQTYFLEKAPILYSERLINELLVFVWNGDKASARNGYNDDLVMALAQGLWLRDTAVRLRTMGIELTKKALTNIHKPIQTNITTNNNYWNMNVGGQQESIKWLLGKK